MQFTIYGSFIHTNSTQSEILRNTINLSINDNENEKNWHKTTRLICECFMP